MHKWVCRVSCVSLYVNSQFKSHAEKMVYHKDISENYDAERQSDKLEEREVAYTSDRSSV